MRDTLLFLILSALPLSLEAECGTKFLSDITNKDTFTARRYQDNWWIAREALCSQNDPCYNGKTNCTVEVVINLQSTLVLSRTSSKEGAAFENCWNGTENIIEQCVKTGGIAEGSWTLPDGAFKYGIEKTPTIPDIGGAALVDKSLPSAVIVPTAPVEPLPPKPLPVPNGDDAYNVTCDIDGFKAWGFSGWEHLDQIHDPKQANTKGSGLFPSGCKKVPGDNPNEGLAFQGCGKYRVSTFERDDCKAGDSNIEDQTWFYAIDGPYWVPEMKAAPRYRSWIVFEGDPQVPPHP